MATNQYVHRLIGYYADRGIVISTDNHGWILTGMQPMTVNLATTIADAVMVAEQGGKSITSVVHLMGNMAQDLAWMRVTPRLMRELFQYRFKEVFYLIGDIIPVMHLGGT